MPDLFSKDGTKDASNSSSITREEKIAKARDVMGMEEGITIDADDQLLASLGYRAELKREFSYLTVFGQSFGAMGIAPAIAESIIFSLGSAGAPGMVWTYLAGCLLLIPVALSLGELGSSMPTSGGLYYVKAIFEGLGTMLTSCSGLHGLRLPGKEHSCAGLRRCLISLASNSTLTSSQWIYERSWLYLHLCIHHLRGNSHSGCNLLHWQRWLCGHEIRELRHVRSDNLPDFRHDVRQLRNAAQAQYDIHLRATCYASRAHNLLSSWNPERVEEQCQLRLL